MARSLAPSRTMPTAFSTRRSSFACPSFPRKLSVVRKTTFNDSTGIVYNMLDFILETSSAAGKMGTERNHEQPIPNFTPFATGKRTPHKFAGSFVTRNVGVVMKFQETRHILKRKPIQMKPGRREESSLRSNPVY